MDIYVYINRMRFANTLNHTHVYKLYLIIGMHYTYYIVLTFPE